MSDSEEILFKWTNSCRLCLSAEADIDIFSQENSPREIQTKIQSLLNLLIYQGDPMPRKLCSNCWTKLDEWGEFKEQCVKTEQDLKKRLQPYKKIEFVQDYFEKYAKFTSSEVVSSSSKVNFKVCEEPNSTSSKSFAEDASNDSTSSNRAGVSSMSSDLKTDGRSSEPMCVKDISNFNDVTKSQNSTVSEPASRKRRRSTEWIDAEDNSVGTIVSVTGSASALWSSDSVDKASKPNEQTRFFQFNEKEVQKNIKKKLTKICEDCNVWFPSVKEFELHKCMSVDCEALSLPDDTSQGDVEDIKIDDDSSLDNNSLRRSMRRKTQVLRYIDQVEESSEFAKRSKPCPLVHKLQRFKNDHSQFGKLKMTPWKCIPCVLYFSSKETLTQHYNSGLCLSGRSDVYKCEFCSREYPTYFELLQHQIVHIEVHFQLTDDDLLCCGQCDLQFPDKWRLHRHSLVHAMKQMPSVTTRYPCSDCGEVYIRKDLYEKHVRSHNNPHEEADSTENPEELSCETCEMKFYEQRALDEHKKTHLGSGTIRCRRCGKVFTTAEELEQHESTKHKNPTPFSCRKCSVKFSSRSHLLLHLRSHLPKSDPDYRPSTQSENSNVCTICKSKFMIASDLQSHMKTHKSPRPPSMPAMPVISVMGEEEQEESDPKPGSRETGLLARYKCSLCSKVFCQAFSIVRHGYQAHPGEQPVAQRLKRPIPMQKPPTLQSKKVKCHHCFKQFSSKTNLNVHMATVHAGTKMPFIKQEHPPHGEQMQRLASEEGMEKCPYCMKPFKNSYLRGHIKRAHRGEVLDPESQRKEITGDMSRVCRYCFKVCSTVFNRELHESIHYSPGKVKWRKCDKCEKKFFNKVFFDKHIASCKVNKSFHCSICNKIFFNYLTFQRHSCFANEESHTCSLCGETFASPHLLQLHISNSHPPPSLVAIEELPGTSSLPFQPEPRVRTDKKQKERELWREESNKIVCKVGDKFYCTLCDVEFSTVEECRGHQSVHPRGNWYAVQIQDSLFQCTICDKYFDTRKGSLIHINYHKQSGSSPVQEEPVQNLQKKTTQGMKRTYKCPFCSSTFSTEENIKNHIFYIHPDNNVNYT